MGGPHDGHLIAEGLPGEGNMLIYDNAMYTFYSRALEVDIKTGEVAWQSEPEFGIEGYVSGRVHFSPFISGADRFPNGNTVVTCGGNGVVFEVTRENELVWHWVRPDPEPVAPTAEGTGPGILTALRGGNLGRAGSR